MSPLATWSMIAAFLMLARGCWKINAEKIARAQALIDDRLADVGTDDGWQRLADAVREERRRQAMRELVLHRVTQETIDSTCRAIFVQSGMTGRPSR